MPESGGARHRGDAGRTVRRAGRLRRFIDIDAAAGHALAEALNGSRPFNIRVNTPVPGWMTDRQIRLCLDAAGREAIARGQCLQQPLLAEQIARMALFLATDDSAMCTAQNFVVDAGST